ncbi:hypothetical protein GMSM_16080 [Geomonas sp. Red276]
MLAARNEEVIQYPSLLMLGDINQSLGVSYSYAEHISPSNSSSISNSLMEKYTINATGAVLDPHLLSLQMLGGLTYSQQFSQENLKLFDAEYSIVGSGLDLTYHPFSFGSSHTTSYISNGYQPTYAVTSNNNQVSATLMNSKVPLQLFYLHSTSDTEGRDENTHSATDAAGILLHHDYQDVSNTNLSLTTTNTEAGTSTSTGYSLAFGNDLAFDKARQYRLSTNLNINDSRVQGIPQRNISLTSQLGTALGKALQGTFGESYTYNSTLNFQNEDQTERSNTLSGSLSHRLYQSLLTSVSGSMTNGRFLGGSTESYSGSGKVIYMKQLPAQANLMLTFDGALAYSSQQFPLSQFAVRDEVHSKVNWGDKIKPNVAGQLTAVITVTSADKLIIYQEGADYRVDLVLGTIEILTAGQILPGSDIAISYTVAVNNSIRYRTGTYGTFANLALAGGRYNLSASYSTQEQTLLAGQATSQGLSRSTALLLRADANWLDLQAGAEYGEISSTQEDSYHASAYTNYNWRTDDNALLGFSLRDTYAVLKGSHGTNNSGQNSASLAANYSRRIFGFISAYSALTINDTRGSGSYADFMSLRCALNGMFNQLQFTLSGQYIYRLAGSTSTQDRNVTCSVTRFF